MIPNYEGFMKPLLEFLSDGQIHSSRECTKAVYTKLNLSEEEQSVMLPSKTQSVSANRFHWARTYLNKAGAIHTVSRGNYQITEIGHSLLLQNSESISTKDLLQYHSFTDFYHSSIPNPSEQVVDITSLSPLKTPDEIMHDSYLEMREQVAKELLDLLLQQTPAFFEAVVVSLLEKMGYGEGKITGHTGDEGIDGIIDEDKLGLDVIHIQAKRYKLGNNVGRPALQSFVGALAGQNGTKGVFITTSDFTKDAQDYQPAGVKIVKINGKKLAELMFDYDLGVSARETYVVKKIDSDFFDN